MLLSYWLTSFWMNGKATDKVWKGVPIFLTVGAVIGFLTTLFMVAHVHSSPDYTPMERAPELIIAFGVFLVSWLVCYFAWCTVLFIKELRTICTKSNKVKCHAIANYIWIILSIVYLGYAIMDMSYVNGGF